MRSSSIVTSMWPVALGCLADCIRHTTPLSDIVQAICHLSGLHPLAADTGP